MALQHEHHDLALSTLHVHLDHDNCLETMILRGPTELVRSFADSVIAERGGAPRPVEFGAGGHGYAASSPRRTCSQPPQRPEPRMGKFDAVFEPRLLRLHHHFLPYF
ncbi:MAG: hypothetical protein WC091_23175 [Sulfuricellaceae bacterium]